MSLGLPGVVERCGIRRGSPCLGIEERGAAGLGGLVWNRHLVVLPHALERRKHFSGAGLRSTGDRGGVCPVSGAPARVHLSASCAWHVAAGQGSAPSLISGCGRGRTGSSARRRIVHVQNTIKHDKVGLWGGPYEATLDSLYCCQSLLKRLGAG